MSGRAPRRVALTDPLPPRLERIEFQLPLVALLFLALLVLMRLVGISASFMEVLIYLGGFALALVGLVVSLIGLVVARLRGRSVRTWAESLLASAPVAIVFAAAWSLGSLQTWIE